MKLGIVRFAEVNLTMPAGATATAAGTSLGYGAGRLAQYSLSPVV